MFALSSSSSLAPLRAAPTRPSKRTTSKRSTPVAISTAGSKGGKAGERKKLSQQESVLEMGGIVAQAFGVGIALPVGVVSLLEASKNIPGADTADTGLYGFMALTLGCGVWWGVKTGERDRLRAELEAKVRWRMLRARRMTV